MSIQYKSQQISYQILNKFNSICNDYNIKYSLAFSSLYGAIKNRGFLEFANSIDVMMLYDEYIEFLKVAEKEFSGTDYYLANYGNRDDIDYLYTCLCKKSEVRLPSGRENDEFYYDYHIRIYPIFAICSEEKAFQKAVDEYAQCVYIINSRKRGKDLVGAKDSHYKKNVYPILKKDKKQAFSDIVKLAQKHNSENKFAILPCQLSISKSQYNKYDRLERGCVKLTETYSDYTEIQFEDGCFMAIKNYEEWLIDYYEKDYYNSKRENIKGNLILLQGPEIRRRVQLVQRELLIQVDQICRKHNIKYCICAGTLLGAVRHKGFIPWDYDADILMLRKEYEKFCEIAEEELDSGKYWIEDNEKKVDRHLVFAKLRRKGTLMARYLNSEEGISIDIFPIYNGSDNVVEHILQTKLCMFFKTVCWANVRASELKGLKNKVKYKPLSLIPLSIAFKAYMFGAKLFEKRHSNHISWLLAASNPFYSEYTRKSNYEETIDIEFEGYMFSTMIGFEKYLLAAYAEYMQLPPNYSHYEYYTFSFIDVGKFYNEININLKNNS